MEIVYVSLMKCKQVAAAVLSVLTPNITRNFKVEVLPNGY